MRHGDRLNRLTDDVLNCLALITAPANRRTFVTYDANGNLFSVTDANTRSTTYTHYTLFRRTSRQDAFQQTETDGYDANGNVSTIADRKGQATPSLYDGLNRRTRPTYAEGRAPEDRDVHVLLPSILLSLRVTSREPSYILQGSTEAFVNPPKVTNSPYLRSWFDE